jgi:hypothetical protein
VPLSQTVPVTERYPVSGMDPGAPVRAEAVGDLSNTTEGRISCSEMLLVAGTSRLVRRTKNFVL